MRRGAVLALTAAALAGVPALALSALAMIGTVPPPLALTVSALTGAAAVLLAAIWADDLARLRRAIRQAAEGAPLPAPRPRLGPLSSLAGELDALARMASARAAQSGRQRARDEAIVEHLPDPLVVLGPDRAPLRVNAAAREAFGADLPALLRHPALRAALRQADAQSGPQRAELQLDVPVPRALQATALRLAATEETMLVLSDRTRERAVERMRADFVANASHELRTPLASLIGFIDTLRGPAADDPPAQQRFLAIMAEQAARMHRLIDDLLGLSRIELLEHQLPADAVRLGPLARRVAAGFEPRLAERGVRLALDVPDDLPAVRGDADQLAQVLQNLLDNALKYGGDDIRLALRPAAAGERWPAGAGVVLAVSDAGPGIPRAHLPRLTERFYRVDAGRSRNAGGTGLGLAIVKHIVNRHRGQLRIASEEGRGSVFSVWLPVAP